MTRQGLITQAVNSLITDAGDYYTGTDVETALQELGIQDAFTTQNTAGGTTTLTAASARIQEFDGTLDETVKLPLVTTLENGDTFRILNASTRPTGSTADELKASGGQMFA